MFLLKSTQNRIGILFPLLMLLALLMAACGGGDDAQPTPVNTAQLLVVTATPDPFTSALTQTAVFAPPADEPTATPTETYVPVQATCQKETSWPVYRVVSGDTLSEIAQRSGTTTNTLVTANCLSNPGLLNVGQSLYVPRTPLAARQGSLSVSPYESADAGNFVLTPDSEVNLAWTGLNNGATRVDFYLIRTNSTVATLLGSDTYLADGATFRWLVPGDTVGQLSARAYLPDGRSQIPEFRPQIYAPRDVGPVGSIQVDPILMAEGGAVTVEAGKNITISWSGAPLVGNRVEFYATQGQQVVTLGTDTNLSDGSSIIYTVPQSWSVTLTAKAFLANNRTQDVADSLQVFAGYDAPAAAGYVIPSPYNTVNGNTYTVEGGTTIDLKWFEVGQGAARVDFYVLNDVPNPSEQLIGTDNNLTDGASVQWTVPVSFRGTVRAVATFPNFSEQTTAGSTTIQALHTDPPPPSTTGYVIPQPYVSAEGTTYTLTGGATVTLVWEAEVASADRVEFYFWPTGTGAEPSLYATDSNPADGASVPWTVPDNGYMGRVTAQAFFSDGRKLESNMSTLYSEPDDVPEPQ